MKPIIVIDLPLGMGIDREINLQNLSISTFETLISVFLVKTNSDT